MLNTNEPWGLDTRHLAALEAISRTKSLSRAAEELGFGQSAVSQQLAALERVVGQRLVDRGSGPRPVTLTAAGVSFLGHAVAILERLQTAKNDLESLAAGESGRISVGTFQSAGARLLPSVLVAFRKRWPEITVQLHEETSDGVLANRVMEGSLDVAFLEVSQAPVGLCVVELLKDRYVALVSPLHRLADRGTVSLSEFVGDEFVAGSESDPCTILSDGALRLAGVVPKVVFRTDENTARQRLVGAGLGVAISPGLTVEPSLSDGAVVLEIVEPLHRTIGLVWSAERTPSQAVFAFRDVAAEVLA